MLGYFDNTSKSEKGRFLGGLMFFAVCPQVAPPNSFRVGRFAIVRDGGNRKAEAGT